MMFPRTLLTLALCLSAAAAFVPTPVARDETLTARQNNNGGDGYNNGGRSGGNSGDNSGENRGNNDGHDGGHNNNHEGHSPQPSHRPTAPSRRRALDTMDASEIAVEICPKDYYGCPIAASGSLATIPTSLEQWVSNGYECVAPDVDLRDCGGCSSLDAKHDCTLIPGANDISCVAGACVVYSCFDGYVYDLTSKTCVAK